MLLQKYISLALISGLLLLPQAAHAACLTYTDRVNLRGTMVEVTYPLSPDEKKIYKNAKTRPFWFIQLTKPVCITADPNKSDLNMAEDSIDIFEMEVSQDQYTEYQDLVGGPIHITGTLFGAIGTYHHSPVVIDNIEFLKN